MPTQLPETRVLQPVENTQITGVYSEVWIFFQRPLRTPVVRWLMTSVAIRPFPNEKVGDPPRFHKRYRLGWDLEAKMEASKVLRFSCRT
jgi:hypothetical protein